MFVMSAPSKKIFPVVGGIAPVMALNSVVLPAPLGPRTARRSPALSVIHTLSTARKAPNFTQTLVRLKIGSATFAGLMQGEKAVRHARAGRLRVRRSALDALEVAR